MILFKVDIRLLLLLCTQAEKLAPIYPVSDQTSNPATKSSILQAGRNAYRQCQRIVSSKRLGFAAFHAVARPWLDRPRILLPACRPRTSRPGLSRVSRTMQEIQPLCVKQK